MSVFTRISDRGLNDVTGNRRFWVVPVNQRINVQQLAMERDAIWGAAVALYLAGEQCWLTPAEEQLSQDMAADYQTSHPWEARIEAYLLEFALEVVTTSELLTKALEIDIGRQSKRDEMEVAGCLKRLGWRQVRKQHDGKRRRVWMKESQGFSQDTRASQPSTSNQLLPAQSVLDQPVSAGVVLDELASAQPSPASGRVIATEADQPARLYVARPSASVGQPGQPLPVSIEEQPPSEPLLQEEDTGQGILVRTAPIDSWEGMAYE